MSETVIGIQGELGSYNDVAIKKYLMLKDIKSTKIEYLKTAENVLRNLRNGHITYGQYAIKTTSRGAVKETELAIKKHLKAGMRIKTIAEYSVPTTHCIISHSSMDLEGIKMIICHPEVIFQCEKNLQLNYSAIELVDYYDDGAADSADVAIDISKGLLNKEVATLGNPKIAKLIDNLHVISEELQDSEDNHTTFNLVSTA